MPWEVMESQVHKLTSSALMIYRLNIHLLPLCPIPYYIH